MVRQIPQQCLEQVLRRDANIPEEPSDFWMLGKESLHEVHVTTLQTEPCGTATGLESQREPPAYTGNPECDAAISDMDKAPPVREPVDLRRRGGPQQN